MNQSTDEILVIECAPDVVPDGPCPRLLMHEALGLYSRFRKGGFDRCSGVLSMRDVLGRIVLSSLDCALANTDIACAIVAIDRSSEAF